MKIASRLVNFDACPGDPFRAVATPIYQTATFEQASAEQVGPYDYSRSGNPTRTVLETNLARLENAAGAYCFASGMAAISVVARLLSAGDEILAGDDLYGGTYRLFSTILDRTGISVSYADACDLQHFAAQITPKTRLIFVESPTNPLLRIADLRALAALARSRGVLLCVDSSAMSPYLQNPLDLGADIVVHSATKYLSGHGDVTAGVVAVRSPEIGERVYHVQNSEGSALGPLESYLLLRSIKTLKLRIDAQQENAARVADYLSEHPAVQKLYYPGRREHRGHDLHFSQARGAGAVISFETGSFDLSRRVAEATQIFRIRVSFGSVNSSITLPGCMSHASIPEHVRKERALAPDLVRLSVGIEDVDDLIADLGQAFAQAMQEEVVSSQNRQD